MIEVKGPPSLLQLHNLSLLKTGEDETSVCSSPVLMGLMIIGLLCLMQVCVKKKLPNTHIPVFFCFFYKCRTSQIVLGLPHKATR